MSVKLLRVSWVFAILLCSVENSYEESEERFWMNNVKIIFILNGGISSSEFSKQFMLLLSKIIDPYGSSFTIWDGSDGSTIFPESISITRMKFYHEPNEKEQLNCPAIKERFLHYSDSQTAVQEPVHTIIVNKHGCIDEAKFKDLKALNKYGKTFSITLNGAGQCKDNPKINDIINVVQEAPTFIKANRIASFLILEKTIDRDATLHIKMDFKGTSSSTKIKLIVNGTESAPLSVCEDIVMNYCNERSENNTFVVLLNYTTNTLFISTNQSNDHYCDNCRFEDSSKVILEFQVIESNYMFYLDSQILQIILIFFGVLSGVVISVYFVYFWYYFKYKKIKTRYNFQRIETTDKPNTV